MRSRKLISASFILAIAFSVILACKGLPAPATSTPAFTDTPLPTSTPLPTDTPEPTPTPISYDGEWKGATSQDLKLSFTVVNNGLTSIAIKAKLEGAGCTVTMETTGTFTTPYPIENGTFTIASGGGGTDHTFTGTFTSPDSASGTLEYVNTGGCSGTIKVDWTATKSP
jgi:hypothetical protein